jgi:predicted ATPase/DNA-binding CsgD family transcriptional regulator
MLKQPSDKLPPVRVLLGRQHELDRVGAFLMGPPRLVTLIGSGGIGKTRLAEEAVRRLHRARRTPVFTVRLARLPKGADVAAVRETVAVSVLVEGFVGASAWDGAVQRLSPVDAAGRAVDTVLLLDNCEHVLAGVSAVVADLPDAVAGLTILATSREPIGWVDEQLVAVPPLSVNDSLELFRQRAELAGHPITEPDQVGVAEQICGHMHGNPLCIRLAAARMFYEPLPMILEQLSGESDDMRMRWRHGPRVGAEDRHRTITDVIAWSYDLCGDKERLLFDRLSAFAPGYDVNPPHDVGTGVVDVGAELEAIEVVCADDVPIPDFHDAPSTEHGDQVQPAVRLARTEIRGLLERLVQQSLVSIHMTVDTVRYFLLESLRLFASDRLAQRSTAETDEPARLARRHRYYYRDKILHGCAEWFGPADRELLIWARGAWSNIRRAIDTSIATGEPVVGLQIAVALVDTRALFVVGSLPEIRARLEQTLAATQASGTQLTGLQLVAKAHLAWLALIQGRAQDAEELLERCVAACKAKAAHAEQWRDRPETDVGLPAVVDYTWGIELLMVRRDPRAIAVLARAREKFHDIGDRGGEAVSELFEAIAAGSFGSAEQAMTISQRHLERTTAAAAGWERSYAQMALAVALTKNGDAEAALKAGRAALAYQLTLGDRWGMMFVIHGHILALAGLIADQIATETTSRSALVTLATEIAYLTGGLKTVRAELGVLIENLGPVGDVLSIAEKVAVRVLGQKTYIEAVERGSRLSAERFEVHRLALGTLSINASTVEHPPRRGTSSRWQTLSKAEREVAILAAAGWSNSAIGVRRGTSTRTTDAQLSSILQKLRIDAREDIEHYVPEDQHGRVSAERFSMPRQNREKP